MLQGLEKVPEKSGQPKTSRSPRRGTQSIELVIVKNRFYKYTVATLGTKHSYPNATDCRPSVDTQFVAKNYSIGLKQEHKVFSVF